MSAPQPYLTLALVVASTVLGLMGTDLVLPAVPSLPETLGGDTASAQLVLAAYVAGTCAGLLAFGALGDRIGTHALLMGSLLGTCAVSLACAYAPDLTSLILLRALQGAVASAPAIFAPGIVRLLFDDARAIRAMGALGSIESLAPAIAPIIGVWLLALGGWQLSFLTLSGGALLLALLIALLGRVPQTARRAQGSYTRLLGEPVFLRYALSQAMILGGLLTFVFGMPAVFVRALGGTITDFIVMQVSGIAAFVFAANLSGRFVERFGPERIIAFGTILSMTASGAILGYALAGGASAAMIALLFVPVGVGLGMRGPPGFYRAVVAAQGDDARGSALVILGILGAAATGTATAAPFLEQGLAPLAATTFAMHVAAVLSLALLPRLRDAPES